jgi:hypothetical protein
MTSENKPSWFLLFTVFAIACILIAFVATIVFWDSCQSLSCGTIKWETVVANSEYIWDESDELIRLLREAELPKDYDTQKLHAKICKTTLKSPLCEDIEILRRIDTIGREKWVPVWLLVGIMFAESTLGTNYNKPACKSYNNPYWIKGRKYDTGKVEWYTTTKGRADSNGCWLYKFDSIDEATYSLANTISIGYAGCNNSVRCLSRKYVGHPDIEEESWINRVSLFLK